MHLILVRHAAPAVTPDTEATAWPLTAAGRRAAEALADKLRVHADVVVSSQERKAIDTARPIAEKSGLTVELDARLTEARRQWVDGDYRHAALAWLNGDSPATGWEPRKSVVDRWDSAIVDLPAAEVAVVVGHGLAMTAWAADRFGIDPASFWTRLETPGVRIFHV